MSAESAAERQMWAFSMELGAPVTHLRTDWVDSDSAIQLLFGQSTLERSGEALCHFSRVWTQYMKAHNTLLRCRIVIWISWSLFSSHSPGSSAEYSKKPLTEMAAFRC